VRNALFEVDVRPPQPEQFAATHARLDGEDEDGLR